MKVPKKYEAFFLASYRSYDQAGDGEARRRYLLREDHAMNNEHRQYALYVILDSPPSYTGWRADQPADFSSDIKFAEWLLSNQPLRKVWGMAWGMAWRAATASARNRSRT